MAEYAVVLGVIAIAVVVTLGLLSTAISNLLNNVIASPSRGATSFASAGVHPAHQRLGRAFGRLVRAGRLAQLGEHLPYKQGVGGSIPSPPTSRAEYSRRCTGCALPTVKRSSVGRA